MGKKSLNFVRKNWNNIITSSRILLLNLTFDRYTKFVDGSLHILCTILCFCTYYVHKQFYKTHVV